MVRIRTVIVGALALMALGVPATANAAIYTPSSPGPTYANIYRGSVTKQSGYWQARATGPTGYARTMFRPSSAWTTGQNHTFGGRFQVMSSRGYVALLRADNYSAYGGNAYVFGVSRYNSDGRGRLVVKSYNGSNEQVIGPAFNIPVGTAFDLKVKITIGSRISAIVNGSTVASGTFRASGKDRITSVRAGVVATGNSGTVEVRQQNFTIDQ